MGSKISSIAYNEEYDDANIVGLSKTQVSLIKEHFYAILEECNSQDKKMTAGILSNLIQIPKEEAETVIDFVDLDGDGYLDEYDFVCMVGLFTKASRDEKLQSIFYLFDEDFSQIITKKELEKMITCILCINQGSPQINKNAVKDKIQEIQDSLFQVNEPELKIADFLQLAKEDNDIKNAFLKIGVFKDNQDLDDYLGDIQEELERGQEDIREDQEQFQRRKLGMDEKMGDFNIEAENADEFMAIKPFVGVVKNSVPSDFNPKKVNMNEPNANLELEFVHGYRCFDTRNNIFFIDENNIAFHTAGIGVSMNIPKREQSFNFQNTDDITCIDKYGDLIATGQIGHKPIINIWNCKTMQTIGIITGQLEKGIGHVCISRDGHLLAATAMNDDHDIAIYDISDPKNPKLKCHSKGVKDVVLDLKFTLDSQTVIMATAKELYLASFQGAKIKVSKTTGWGNVKDMILCIGFLQKQDFVVGMKNGSLGLIRGSTVSKMIPAHKKPLYAICSNQDHSRLFTGGGDGKVILWDHTLKPLKEIMVKTSTFLSINPMVRAMDYNDQSRKLLIGTRGGEIISYDTSNDQREFVIQGHFNFELWGLAAHPSQNEFVTVGEDFLLAKWDIKSRKQLLQLQLKFQANTIAVSFDGKMIAIGCKNGYILVLYYQNFSEIKTIISEKKEITQVKFSKNGKYLAAASRSSQIKIYILPQFKLAKTLKGHHSTITHMDFSEDSNVLMSNCTSYEILFWNLEMGKQDTRGASNNKDEKWQSWTCVLGWPVQGIFPPCSDGTDINSVDRSKDGTVCVTGDDFGTIKLFNFPNFDGSSYNKCIGHSSHVTNVRFSYNDQYLISVGGNDKSIFQWKYESQNFKQENYDAEEDYDELDLPKEERQVVQQKGIFDVQEEDADEFMAIKPWIGNLNASIPSNFKVEKGMELCPQQDLELHYINGYRNHDARNMAKLLPQEDQIVFCSAALGVTMDIKKNHQQFFKEHEEDVISFDLHPNKKIAATGQMAMKGKSKLIDIFVWDVETKEVLAQLNGFHLRAIQILKFSPDGSKLLSFGKDDDNSLAIYDWKNKRIIATQKVDKKNVLDSSFDSDSQFITVGSSHIKEWKLNGTSLKGTRIDWGKIKPEAILCSASVGGGYVIGTISGKIYTVRGGLGKSVQAHQGKIYVMCYDNKTKKLYTGGDDGVINSFNCSSGSIQLEKKITQITEKESLIVKIRSLDILDEKMLIGTGANQLFYMKNYQNDTKKCILYGHSVDELWGLTSHATEPIFYTCGDDALVKKWDAKNRLHLGEVKLESKSRALCCSNKGDFVIVGTYTAQIVLLDNNLKILNTYQSSFTKKNQWIQDIKVSPDDQYVAFGAHGGASDLEVLKVSSNKLSKYAIIKPGLTSALLHLDWSSDSSQIVINSQAYELKFADVLGKRQVSASGVKDVEWFTWTCKIGFPVQGIYPGVDGTDVNTVDRSKNNQLLATGDDFQLVKIFKYPSVTPKSEFKAFKGHASHVTRVKFLDNDQYLISIGGLDKTSIIWKTSYCKDKNVQENLSQDLQDEEDDMMFVKAKTHKQKYEEYEDENNMDEEQEVEEGGFKVEQAQNDEFMAIKPWLGAIKAPSDYISSNFDQKKPNIDVKLEYVYGYRAKDCRNNLFYKKGSLYYFAAALGINLNVQNNTQSFFSKHSDDVISMDYCPSRDLFATGQLGPKPEVYVWNSKMEIQKILKGGVIKGVNALKFSPNGSKLGCVCIDDNHLVVIFDVDKQEVLAYEKGDTAKIVDLEWQGEDQFVTVGISHFKSWKITGSTLKATKGSFGKYNNKLIFAKKYKSDVLCGSTTGDLQVWSGSSCTKSIQMVNGVLDALCITPSGLIILGGTEGNVIVLNSSLKKLNEIQLKKYLLDSNTLKLRSITISEDEKELFVGLYSSEIYSIKSNENKVSDFKDEIQSQQLMNGHYAKNLKWTNEVWGLYPLKDNMFLSVSDDATLRMWNANERKIVKQLNLNIDVKGGKLQPDPKTKDLQEQSKLRSVTVCSEEKHIAVGCKEGTVRIVDVSKWKQIKLIKNRQRWIQELRYSPDNTKLAVGSHDCFIDIYSVEKNYKILFKMKKHSSFITHLDWSQDSNYLHSNCGAYELLFWNITNGTQITSGASALRDEKWATWSCVLGWPVQGIFQAEWDGSDVNMVDRSKEAIADGQQLIACADDFSEIRIYKFPCINRESGSIILKGHSSHVTNVKFNDQDNYLFSAGGEDQCLMQWKLNY